MSPNLITSGIIDPTQLPLEAVKLEVAAVLKIPPSQIERLECWKSQIWVKIVESRAKFVSYRQLPLWIAQGIAVIQSCENRLSLDQLGEILRNEREWYDAHKQPEAVQPWRDAWAKQAQVLREEEARREAEEERLRPMRIRQQTAKEWQLAWKQVLRFCPDCESLESLTPVIEVQSLEFADLPEVTGQITLLWYQRWQELSQRRA